MTSSATPHLARLNVTPLKGTGLAHPATAELTDHGIPGNRRFHLVDAGGRLFTAADHGPLVRLRVAFDPATELLRVAFPDGSESLTRTDRLGDPVVTDVWSRPVPGRLVTGPVADAVGAYVGRPLRIVMADVEGDGSDIHRLSIMSLASVSALGARHGRPDLDPQRFRMDLELEGCEPHQEDTWAGLAIGIGEAVVRVLGPIPRCVVTTRDPATGRKDFDTLKRIADVRPLMEEPRGVPFGMYAEVERPGRISVGNPVHVLGR